MVHSAPALQVWSKNQEYSRPQRKTRCRLGVQPFGWQCFQQTCVVREHLMSRLEVFGLYENLKRNGVKGQFTEVLHMTRHIQFCQRGL